VRGVSQEAQSTTQPQQEVVQEQQKLLELLNELLMTIHEVVYTSNLLDDEIVKQHPELQDLVTSIKKLGKVSWNFHKYVKSLASRARK